MEWEIGIIGSEDVRESVRRGLLMVSARKKKLINLTKPVMGIICSLLYWNLRKQAYPRATSMLLEVTIEWKSNAWDPCAFVSFPLQTEKFNLQESWWNKIDGIQSTEAHMKNVTNERTNENACKAYGISCLWIEWICRFIDFLHAILVVSFIPAHILFVLSFSTHSLQIRHRNRSRDDCGPCLVFADVVIRYARRRIRKLRKMWCIICASSQIPIV